MEATLNNGQKMPMIIFGTFDIKPHEVKDAILAAIRAGYTHIDAAAIYRNETEIGEALAEAFATGLTTREKLFITTKVWCSNFRNIKQALLHSLKRLQLTYVDHYLLHWPFALKEDTAELPNHIPGPKEFDNFPLHLAWPQMEALVDEGLVKSIGVSNWTVALLHDLLTYARIFPATNQFEANPYNNKKELIEYCQTQTVIPVLYRAIYRPAASPLFPFQKSVLDDQLVLELAQKYAKTPAQVILQWCLARNCPVIVKTVTPARMTENLESQSFKMDDDDVSRISALPFQGEYNDTYQLFGIHLFK